YFLSVVAGPLKNKSTPTESFWCCTGTGLENHARYGDTIYAHSPDHDTLWINLFIASELRWKEKGVTLEQITSFPEDSASEIRLKMDAPERFSVKIRIPSWTSNPVLKVNSEPQSIDLSPGSYATIDRSWKDGDKIELTLPASVHLYRPQDDPNCVVAMVGPIVLAGELGKEGMPASDQARDQNDYNKVPPVPAPPLSVDADADPAKWLQAVPGEPLHFTAHFAAKDLPMVPLYQVHHQRYAVYWK